MLKALYSGVAGLKSHQTRMDVIGNNIANVNTAGFKASRVTFKDVLYQTTKSTEDATERVGGGNASQIGYGSSVSTIDVLHGRTGYSATGRALDVAVEGSGYLIAKDAEGDTMYTRVGALYFDADGYLVDANRNYICGYPITGVESGTLTFKDNVPVHGTGTIGNATNGLAFQTDKDTIGELLNGWNFAVKVDSTAAQSGVEITGKTVTVTLKTAAEYTATDIKNLLDQLKTDAAANDPDAIATLAKLPTGVADFTNVTITANGTPVAPADGAKAFATTITGGVSKLSGIPLLDDSQGAVRIKKPNTLVDADGDGFYDSMGAGIADLINISVGNDGTISGTTTEGVVIPIGRLCLANIPNPDALVMQGNSYLKAEKNTGEIEIEPAGSGQAGSVVSGNLEMSNVDLSTEFSDMITTQRGFQANSRVITVGDTLLEELINLKR